MIPIFITDEFGDLLTDELGNFLIYGFEPSPPPSAASTNQCFTAGDINTYNYFTWRAKPVYGDGPLIDLVRFD